MITVTLSESFLYLRFLFGYILTKLISELSLGILPEQNSIFHHMNIMGYKQHNLNTSTKSFWNQNYHHYLTSHECEEDTSSNICVHSLLASKFTQLLTDFAFLSSNFGKTCKMKWILTFLQVYKNNNNKCGINKILDGFIGGI